jgi:hypothetical protein
MKDQFNKFGFGKMKKKDGSVEETPGSKFFFIKHIISIFLQTSRKSVQVTLFGHAEKIHH